MAWQKQGIELACALALLATAGPGFGQARLDQPTQNPPTQTNPSTPDGPAQGSSTQPSQSIAPGSASILDQPIAPDAAGGAPPPDGSERPDTLTQPAQPDPGGQQSQDTLSELRGKIIDQRQVGVEGTETPNTVVLLETEDGQRVAIDLGAEGTLSGANLRDGGQARIKGMMLSVGGNPVFIARELDLGGQTWRITRSRSDRLAQLEASGNQSQLSGTIQYFEDVDLRGGSGKNRVALIETGDGRRMLVDLGPVGGLGSIQLNRGDQVSITGHNAWVSGERSMLFADQVRARGQTLDINRPPYSPDSPESTGPAGQAGQPPASPGQPGAAPGSQPQGGQGPGVPGTINFEPGQANPPLDQGGSPAAPGTTGSGGAQGTSANANEL